MKFEKIVDPLSHWNKEENRLSSEVLKPFIILQPISWLLCPAGPSNPIQGSFIICCTDQWGPLQRTLSFPWLQVKRLLPNLQNISLRVVFIGFFFFLFSESRGKFHNFWKVIFSPFSDESSFQCIHVQKFRKSVLVQGISHKDLID